MTRKCVVCAERPRANLDLFGNELCDQCLASWDASQKTGAITWAARRARMFERRRNKRAREVAEAKALAQSLAKIAVDFPGVLT